MSLLKELLLLFITIMHMSLVASRPVVGSKSGEEKQNEIRDLNIKFGFVLSDLKRAESVYVIYFFNNTSNTNRNLEPLDGITFPAGNITDPDTLNSMCALSDYLENHLPPIISNLTSNETIKEEIIKGTKLFQNMFKSLPTLMKKYLDEDKLMECRREQPTSGNFAMKMYALRILHTAGNWTESYTSSNLL